MNIVLVCLNNFQDYILINIKQLIRLNHENIYIITDKIFFNNFSEYNNKINLIAKEDLDDSYNYFLKNNLDKSFRNGFWVYSSSRFFYIYEFMKKYNINNVIHLENDVLIYYNCNLLINKINNNFIYLPFDSFDRNIASIMYIPNHNILKIVLDNYDLNKNDMYNFSSIMKKTNLINNFPIFISNEKEDEEYNFVTRNYENFKFIFDAAAIGQYLGGVDKKNNPNDTIGFINETCIINYSTYKFILFNNENIIKPFILIENKYIPIFNLHIHCKDLNKFIYENTINLSNNLSNNLYVDKENTLKNIIEENLFDIIIPIGINDFDCIQKQIIYTKKNIIGYRNIYLICVDKNIIIDGCITIDEKIFPFSSNYIKEQYGIIERTGWVLQQLLKLYSVFIIPNILDKYLVIDCDTFFLKPVTFIENNCCLYNYSDEYHHEYFQHINKLHPSLKRFDKNMSGICHHMIFEKKYIYELFNLIEKYHDKNFYNIFLENINISDLNTPLCSEYELYFNYMLIHNNNRLKIRNLNWKNVNSEEFFININEKKYDYISYHHYLRDKKYIIFKKSGRLGNTLFRYFACVLFCIKYNYEYILEEECPKIKDYIFYKGVDHENDDIEYRKDNIDNLKNICNKNINALCFNTLGFIKSDYNINNLNSNYYINNENNHGLYVKNIININDDNFFKHYENIKINNLIMDGYFHFDKIYLEHKKEIIDFIEKNKNNHKIKTDRNEIFLIKDLIDNIKLDISKIYDIVIHLRLDDFEGLEDFIEYKSIISLLEKLDLNNKKIAFVFQKVYSDKDIKYVNNLIKWFKENNIEINIECNDLITDFNIMKQCKTLICSNSTLSWVAAYLSKNIELCYIPFSEQYLKRFKKPIENTLFYDVSKEKNCYICGCVLNCEKYLKNVFNNIEKIGKIFNNYKIVIAYDKSNDNTLNTLYELKNKLKNICEFEIIINNNEISNYKTENISNARNSILEFIRNDNNDYQYFIMMDFDDVCNIEIDVNILDKYLIDNKWDSLSFNRKNNYDIWALSIKPFVSSCWHWSEKQMDSLYVVNIIKNYINDKLNNLDKNELLECYSAFNGFAIYRKDKFINCEYSNNIFKSHSLLNKDLIKENIDELNKITQKNNKLVMNLLEDCEHRYFHLSAIQKNNARIMISPLCLFNEKEINKEENDCIYVSSRGILKSCIVKSATPISSINQLLNYDFSKLYDGCTLYVCNYAIPYFSTMINQINCRFILISGDSDCTVPDELFKNNYNDFHVFINNEKIIHWYSQNCVLNHPKLSRIPIGLDYHTMSERNSDWGEKISSIEQENILNNIKNNLKPFWEREIKCYSNFHFFTNTKYGSDRVDAMTYINKELVYYENAKINRKQTWENQSKYSFVISPHGNGLDCHRTWEALCLGCIPIVKKSGISDLFYELPVLIVNDWKDVTIELLNDTINKFKNTIFNYEKLTLEYWMKKINNISTKIIVARYNENIEWTKKFKNLIIYNKGNKLEEYNEILLKNIGREGHTYYKYIYDNYDNLDDYTVFLQGNPFDHSPNLIKNLLKYINNKNLSIDFEFLSEDIHYSTLDIQSKKYNECKNIYNTYEKIFYLKNNNEECIFGAGAQFIVSKKNILKNSKIFYGNILKLLEYSIDPIEGYHIERFHKYIFSNKEKNKNFILDSSLLSYENFNENIIYFIVTTSIFNNCNIRKEQYINGINKLKNVINNMNIKNYKIIIVENNGLRNTFLDNLGHDVYYTNNNSLNFEKGYIELKDILDCINYYNINDNNFIVKMTGRYILDDNSEFINIVKNLYNIENINYDCIIKYGSYSYPLDYKTSDCITGLIGMKCFYIKKIDIYKTNNPIEWNWAKVTYLMDNDKIYKVKTLGINICPGNNSYFLI